MKTYKLGVVGDPISHSLSPKIHNLFAKRANIKIEYEAYHVLPSNLDGFIRDFFDDGGERSKCDPSAQNRLPAVSR